MTIVAPAARVLAAAALMLATYATASAQSSLLEAVRNADRAAALALLREHADAKQTEPDGTTALHWAVHNDDSELVAQLLAVGAEVNKANDYGATPMSEAAVIGNVAVLERLLAAGAEADSANAEGQTALMVVARSSNVVAAELLLKHGADVNAHEERKGQTALMWAAAQSQPAMIEALLAHGAQVDARSTVNQWQRVVTAEPRTKNMLSGGFTPLLYAARQGCVECARLLVDARADIDFADPDGISPLLSALLNAHFDTAKYLLEKGANANKWDWWGRTPLYSAVDFNTIPHGGRPDRPSLDDTTNLQMIELLLAAGANPNAQLKLFPPYRSLRMDRGADSILDIGTTALLRAARGADVPALNALLAHAALVDLPQVSGITPLMAATGTGAGGSDTRGKFRTELDALAAAEVLLQAGAQVNARDERGRTALHAAAAAGYTDIVQLLLEHGADAAAADADGVTPVDAALGKMRGRGRGLATAHPNTAKLLQESLATASR